MNRLSARHPGTHTFPPPQLMKRTNRPDTASSSAATSDGLDDDAGGWGEEALVEALLAGEEAAFDLLAEEYFPKVYRFVLRKVDDIELCRDLVQTALGKAMHRLPGFRAESSLLTWLCACAHNEVRMHRRRQAGSRLVDLDDEQLARAADASEDPALSPVWGPRPVSAETEVLRDEQAQRVHGVLDRLPEKNAVALELKYLRSWPVDRIAATLGLTPKAAESLLTRSRQSFRREFEKLQSSNQEIREVRNPSGAER